MSARYACMFQSLLNLVAVYECNTRTLAPLACPQMRLQAHLQQLRGGARKRACGGTPAFMCVCCLLQPEEHPSDRHTPPTNTGHSLGIVIVVANEAHELRASLPRSIPVAFLQ